MRKWNLIDSKDNSKGVTIKMSTGETCKEGGNFSITFNMICNSSLDEYQVDGSSFNIDKCEHTFDVYSKYSCPKLNFYFVYQVLVERPYIFGSALILLGLFELLLGQKMSKVTVFIITCACVIILVFIFFFQFIIPSGVSETIVWFVLAIAIIVGLILGFFITKYKEKIFGIVLGIVLGYIIGQILVNLVLIRISTSYQKLIQYLTYFGLMIVFAVLSIFFFNYIMIFATALIGAYAIVRGISFFAGGFPNEMTVADLIAKNETEQLKELLTWYVYLYLAGFLVLFIVGMVVQIKIFKKKKDGDNLDGTDAPLVKEQNDKNTHDYYKNIQYTKK